MTVRVYRSTDSSAPALAASAGSMLALLDAVLVNGYGSKTAAGWTKVYTGTNKAAFRGGSGTRFYLRIDDADTTQSRVVGYETMSDVDTGTGPFPTAAQLSGGGYWLRAASLAWIMVADDKTFYLFVAHTTGSGIYWFGDFDSYKPSDAYNCGIMCGISTTKTQTSYNDSYANTGPYGTRTMQVGQWLARGTSGVAGSVTFAKGVNSLVCGSSTAASIDGVLMGANRSYSAVTLDTGVSDGPDYPNPADGAYLLSRVYITDGVVGLRGFFRGLFAGSHGGGTRPSHGDTFSGSGAISTKSFEIIATGDIQNSHASGLGGRVSIETSDTW